MLKNSQQRYGSVAIAFHWLMLVLLIGVYACVFLHEEFPRGSDIRDALKTWHFMLGLSVLALVTLRLVWRLVNVQPAITPAVPRWQHWLASAVHWLLYGFMITMPVAGWLMLSAADRPIPFWGLELPHLIEPDKALSKTIKEAHELAGTIFYWVIGLHALAALVHHYIIKDNTLKRMLGKS
ncbi:cytochrome b [Gilvimarinus polysaccharolyticus]|uniref:cytochrome b n=1 Tax=Gilvimarinus polysaccharolyticus TaxID=863921 RepID=UPI0006737077|nr:cytochrome b [Gilvimarinus polysaccharolyticus]